MVFFHELTFQYFGNLIPNHRIYIELIRDILTLLIELEENPEMTPGALKIHISSLSNRFNILNLFASPFVARFSYETFKSVTTTAEFRNAIAIDLRTMVSRLINDVREKGIAGFFFSENTETSLVHRQNIETPGYNENNTWDDLTNKKEQYSKLRSVIDKAIGHINSLDRKKELWGNDALERRDRRLRDAEKTKEIIENARSKAKSESEGMEEKYNPPRHFASRTANTASKVLDSIGSLITGNTRSRAPSVFTRPRRASTTDMADMTKLIDKLKAEKQDNLSQYNEAISRADTIRDELEAERDAIRRDAEELEAERDAIRRDAEHLEAERDAALAERTAAIDELREASENIEIQREANAAMKKEYAEQLKRARAKLAGIKAFGARATKAQSEEMLRLNDEIRRVLSLRRSANAQHKDEILRLIEKKDQLEYKLNRFREFVKTATQRTRREREEREKIQLEQLKVEKAKAKAKEDEFFIKIARIARTKDQEVEIAKANQKQAELKEEIARTKANAEAIKAQEEIKRVGADAIKAQEEIERVGAEAIKAQEEIEKLKNKRAKAKYKKKERKKEIDKLKQERREAEIKQEQKNKEAEKLTQEKNKEIEKLKEERVKSNFNTIMTSIKSGLVDQENIQLKEQRFEESVNFAEALKAVEIEYAEAIAKGSDVANDLRDKINQLEGKISYMRELKIKRFFSPPEQYSIIDETETEKENGMIEHEDGSDEKYHPPRKRKSVHLNKRVVNPFTMPGATLRLRQRRTSDPRRRTLQHYRRQAIKYGVTVSKYKQLEKAFNQVRGRHGASIMSMDDFVSSHRGGAGAPIPHGNEPPDDPDDPDDPDGGSYIAKFVKKATHYILGLGRPAALVALSYGTRLAYDVYKHPTWPIAWILPSMKEDYATRVEPNWGTVKKHYLHAKVSHRAYDHEDQRDDIGRFMYNRQLSSKKVATYHDRSGHFVIGYQGSLLSEDWYKNIQQAAKHTLRSWSPVNKLLGYHGADDFQIYSSAFIQDETNPQWDIQNMRNHIFRAYEYSRKGMNPHNFHHDNVKFDLTAHSRGSPVVKTVLMDPKKYARLGGQSVSDLVRISHVYNPAVFSDIDKFAASINRQMPNTIPIERMRDDKLEKLLADAIGGDIDSQDVVNNVNTKHHTHRSEFDIISYGEDFVVNQIGHRLHYNFDGVDSSYDWYEAHRLENWLDMPQSSVGANWDEFGQSPNPFNYTPP